MKHCTASARVRLLALPLVQPHAPPRLHQRSLSRHVGDSTRCRRAAYSGSVSQCVASPFNAASSHTSAEKSRAVSLVTSFGSWGPTYVSVNLRGIAH